MILFFRATQEKRSRDRRRFILQVGQKMWHVSRREAISLRSQIRHALGRSYVDESLDPSFDPR